MSDYIDSQIKKNITKLISGNISYETFIELIENICKRVLICGYRSLIELEEKEEKEEKEAQENDADLKKLNELLRKKHSIEILNPELHNLLIDRISFIFAYQDKSSKLSSDMIKRYFIDWLNEHHPKLVDDNCYNQINDGIKLLKIAECFKSDRATILEPNKICSNFEKYKIWLREKRDKFLMGIAYDTIYEPKQWSLMLYKSDVMMSKMQSIIKKIRNNEETLTKWIDKFYSEISKVIEENTIPSYELSSMLVVKFVFQQIDNMCKDHMTRYDTYDLLGLLNKIVKAHESFSSMIQKLINETAKPKAQQMLATNSNQHGIQSRYKKSSSASGSGHFNQPKTARASYPYPDNPQYASNFNGRKQKSLNNHDTNGYNTWNDSLSTNSYPRPDDEMHMSQTSSYFDNNKDRQMGTNDNQVFGQQEFRTMSNNTGVSTRSSSFSRSPNTPDNRSGFNIWQRTNDSETQRNHSHN